MANTPPNGIVELVAKMKQMALGISDFVNGGGTWPGPLVDDVNDTAVALEGLSSQTDSAYAAYKSKKAARDASRVDTVVPIFRNVVAAAYLVLGKDSERLRELGLEPMAAGGASQVPVAPSGLDVREASSNSVLADWDPVPDADRYHVYFGTDMNAMELFGSATKSDLQVTGLTEGTKYFFYVTAVNAAGESAPSNFTTRRTL